MGVTKSLCMCWRRKLSGRAVQSENAGDESEKLWQTVDSLYSIPAWTGNQWRACWRGYIDHICMYWKPISLHSSECTSVLPSSTQLRNSTSNLVDSKIRVPLHPYHNANEGAKNFLKKWHCVESTNNPLVTTIRRCLLLVITTFQRFSVFWSKDPYRLYTRHFINHSHYSMIAFCCAHDMPTVHENNILYL